MNVKSLVTLGLKCPRPLLEVHRAMKDMPAGDRLEVAANDPAFRLDIEAWCRRTGNKLIDLQTHADRMVATIEKAAA